MTKQRSGLGALAIAAFVALASYGGYGGPDYLARNADDNGPYFPLRSA